MTGLLLGVLMKHLTHFLFGYPEPIKWVVFWILLGVLGLAHRHVTPFPPLDNYPKVPPPRGRVEGGGRGEGFSGLNRCNNF